PPLIILSFVVLGLVHGAVMTLLGAATFLFVDSISQGGLANLMAQPWPSVLPVVAAFSGVAAVGVLFHVILRRALLAEQRQRHQISETGKVLEYQERLLHHALRVETAAEAAGMVVHQLRNQFQVMIGHAAVGELASDDEKQERFRKIQEGVAGSRALLDQLLDLSHPHESPKKDVDLGVACANFVANTRRMLPSRVRFVADITSLNLPVSLDPGGLEQALLNLVINACDAIVGVGDLMLKVGPADPGKVEISVADTGPGIPEDQLDGIWEPYFTTKPRGKGTGLGLPSVKRFVESHDGTIELESTSGEGTRFKLTFPLATVQREDSSETLAAPTS
ncbi:MAG: HAMP domain-containing sensor histidine kinase, partial [Planctomycetota bacterium]|nr:HAMP domain-containing sensor histidine kinase [Planctomycetota bacterium]